VLVVTRKRNEAIIIGEGIEVRVLRIGRDGVRIGITAPPHVPVNRAEIYDLIRAENLEASHSQAPAGALASHLRQRAATAEG
jgi:carbon storage regulator